MKTTRDTLLKLEAALDAVSEVLSEVPGEDDAEWNKFSALQGHVNDGLELITPMLDAYAAEVK